MKIEFLGQVGFLLSLDGNKRILIDPYLSNSVELKEDPTIKRMVPIAYQPSELNDIDGALITHAHRDHCDPDTLIPLSEASPHCQFFGPPPVIAILTKEGIDPARLHLVTDQAFSFEELEITPIPSAHPEIKSDPRGGWQAIGYVVDYQGTRYYHPGDTAVSKEIIRKLKNLGDIDVGLIPVNEINFYRNAENIIGNMSVREAFQFAEDIGVKTFIPTHWDMFAKNQVYKEEIELLYQKIQPDFKLDLLKAGEARAYKAI